MLRQYLTSGDASLGGHRFPRIFVLDHAVAGVDACLGASSLTYRVERATGGWRVAGIAARGPVA